MSVPGVEKGRGLSVEAKGWLVAGAAACFVGFLAAMAFQPELGAGADQGAQALSRSPVGFAGLARLLRADGATVAFNRRRDPGRAVGPDVLLVLTPTPSTQEADIRRLAKGRRVLLVPGKWRAVEAPSSLQRLMALGRSPVAAAAEQARAVLLEPQGKGLEVVEGDAAARPVLLRAPATWADPSWRPSSVRPIEGLRSFAGAGVKPVLVDARERTLVAIAARGVSYAVADPDLLSNRALKTAESARTAVSLVEELADGGPVVFDLTLAGVAGGRSALRSAFTPPFLPATAAALLLAGLLGLQVRDRFGALRRRGRVYAFGKRALVDTGASLLAVAGREPRLAGRYVEIARARAVEAVGLAADGDRAQVDAELDRIAVHRGAGAWSALADEARAVRTNGALMALARRVHAWRTEMTLGRG